MSEPTVHRVDEPRPAGVGTLAMLLLFPVIGVVAVVSALRSGEAGGFIVVWFALFAGIPLFIAVTMVRGRGRTGFGVSTLGIHDAADREGGLLPWEEVRSLRWEPTDVRVNGRSQLALVAVLDTGATLRVTSRASHLRRFHDTVERALHVSGVLPAGLLDDDGPVDVDDLPLQPTPEALSGDPFAGLPPREESVPPPPAAPPPAWPDREPPPDPPVWPTRD